MRRSIRIWAGLLMLSLVFGIVVVAQQSVPALVQVGGVLKGQDGKPLTGVQGVTFALYKDQTEGAPLWVETQNVTADSDGRFVALLGATSPTGLPVALFSTGQARWFGIQAAGQPEQPRTFLASVPYSLATSGTFSSDIKITDGSKSSTAGTVSAASGPPTSPIFTIVTDSNSGLQSTNDGNGTATLSLIKTCSKAQLLKWNGTAWSCTPDLFDNGTNVTIGTNLVLPKTNGGGTAGVITLGTTPFLHNFGVDNTFVGGAGNFTMTGDGNTATGASALVRNTTGRFNTATGDGALITNTTGSGNTATGDRALEFNTTGFGNTATGDAALDLTTGDLNTGVGYGAGRYNSTGSANTFIGAFAIATFDSLTNATAIGANAMVGQSDSLVLGSIKGVNGATSSVKVGIGTSTPSQELDVNGIVQARALVIPPGAAAGKVLTSDANGYGTWQTPTSGGGGGGTVTQVNTGPGLQGGPITSTGTISIAPNGVTNSMLQNNTVTIATPIGSGLAGGGAVALGPTPLIISLTTSCAAGQLLKWNGTTWACANDLSGVSGTGVANTLPIFTDPTTLGPSVFSQDPTTGAAKIGVTGGGLQVFPSAAGANIVGGGVDNVLTFGVGGATIGGGGSSASPNRATDGFGTIGGGEGNLAGNDNGSKFLADAKYATVGGGHSNTAGAAGSTVGGGDTNTASGADSTVPGGSNNTASGTNSFAAGTHAKASNDGTFVWADNTPADFASTGLNQFLIRATGGVGVNTSTPSKPLDVNGDAKATRLCIGDDCRSTWPAGGGTITGVTAGSGLTGGGTSGNVTLNVDTSTIQKRVSSNCASTASAIQTVNADGTVNCVALGGSGGIGGSGTPFSIPKFTGPATLGDSQITDDGTTVAINVTNGGLKVSGGNSVSPNVVAGHSDNSANGVVGATISGGGQSGQGNRVTDNGGTVAGGRGNQAGDDDGVPANSYATVSGGIDNKASGITSTVGGGAANHASGNTATVGGGLNNTASGSEAVVPGGDSNVAAGAYSFAAGRHAQVQPNHDGAFVWADSTNADFSSTGPNQFLIRAAAGVGINTQSPGAALDVNGDAKATRLCIGTDCKDSWPAGITGVIAGSGLTGGGTTGNVTLSLANNSVTVPTDPNGGLTGGGSVSLGGSAPPLGLITTCASQQLLKWNGSAWGCGNDNGLILPFNQNVNILNSLGAFSINNGAASAIGIQGISGSSTSGTGAIGVKGVGTGPNAVGIFGMANGVSGTGVFASGGTNTGNGLLASGGTLGGYGVQAGGRGTFAGVFGVGDNSGNGSGVIGQGTGSSGIGIVGCSPAQGAQCPGGISQGTGTQAGKFFGDVNVTGSLSAASLNVTGAKNFKIDHPLDPENKYLYHASVESPDMMNMYNGNVLFDERGEAVVTLPDWFEALNKDFRYQLTSIGGFAPIYVAEEISGNRFKIAGGKAGMKASWQVTGIRKDPYANAHRSPVEEMKPEQERGFYQDPEIYGQPREKGMAFSRPSGVVQN
jgi:hypothetical protein